MATAATVITCLFLMMPGDSIPPLEDGLPWAIPPHADKVVHGLLFFLETLFLHRSMRWWPASRPLLRASGLSLTLALVTELAQGWVPRRNTDGLDLLANSLGVLAFVLVHLMWRRRRLSTAATEHHDQP